MSKHPIRSLSARLSGIDNSPPGVVSLESLLPADRPAGRAGMPTIAPLFRPATGAVDLSDPEVTQQIDAARHRAVQEVQTLNSQAMRELSQRYAETFQRLEAAIASIENVVAAEVVDLAFLVASELIQAEMRHRPDAIVALVEQALAGMPHEGKVRVRLNSEDLATVKDALASDARLEWSVDAALGRGDCIVETPSRIVDASIDARLEAVRDTLVRALMAEEGSDQ